MSAPNLQYLYEQTYKILSDPKLTSSPEVLFNALKKLAQTDYYRGNVKFTGYSNVGGPLDLVKFSEAIAYGAMLQRVNRMQVKAQGGFLSIDEAHLMNNLFDYTKAGSLSDGDLEKALGLFTRLGMPFTARHHRVTVAGELRDALKQLIKIGEDADGRSYFQTIAIHRKMQEIVPPGVNQP